ncbi:MULTISPECIES: Crp/Fnr family transcriptional regulator [Mesorhizobium]|uniref:Crp/Fnr family transcriptional regulator n=1 Tax=Mesorhizobium sp. TaxID=1871066 RepID=UPI000A07CF00|nr:MULTISPECIES: Crp/Fnr family transcriptional regulator [Mesorhizobium]RWL23172.1 MAG: Crp/Fnr family transcriptional regulator [Mesorhizobium sp.]RWM72290.1 MAG: Crp/Fnr family transcriptional regulator [Mesorhizobium sp.]TIO25644.1 MAG: Crp/Fnr family transcriptional regulator [Mesorhizobium sp.]TIQ36322.1 MAG: Crp/Fnr family transcriptional regulator [Mesorhizobium sp.]TJV58126.1 MAG: Crp/Fnr family transcriptional regulator [Mesorhizobium sp.]
MTSNPLVSKLEHGATLRDEDRAQLEKLCEPMVEVSARKSIIEEGDEPDDVHLVMQGLGCRYNLLENGNRSITALLFPGDFCNLHVAILGQMDHGIATLAPSHIVKIPRTTIEDLMNNPRIVRALWWATLVDEGTMRAWLVSAGRQADRQMAHLFCELLARLEAVGLATEGTFDFPVTQEDLGDMLGASIVHVNKTLKALREKGLVLFDGKRVTLPDPTKLAEFAEFDPLYLHLENAALKKPSRPRRVSSGSRAE